MSAYLKLNWKKTSIASMSGDEKKLEDIVGKIADSLPKDKPLVIFFGSYKKKPGKKGKPGKNTREAEKSLDLAKAFQDKTFRVQLALSFCNYYEVDLTNVTEEESPLLNWKRAPLLVVYYKNQLIRKMPSGSSKLIFATLCDALDKCGIDIFGLTKDVSTPIRNLFNTEKKIYDFNKKYNELVAKNRKKKSKAAEMKLKRYSEDKSGLIEEKNALQNKVSEIINKYTIDKKDNS